MKKTVLITGSSTGIGKECALYFHKKGWQVVATMRNPETRTTELHGIENIDLIHLDVTNIDSIRSAIAYAKEKFGTIDVIVNNAGYAVLGLFEATNREQAESQFNTNVFGPLDVIREVIPVLREQKCGIIINTTSVGGRIAVPMYSLYNSTKWALEGFSEALSYELRPFNIKVKVVEPGFTKTDFYGRSMDITTKEGLEMYDAYVSTTQKNLEKPAKKGSHPSVIAKTIFKAASDGSWKFRYPTGAGARYILLMRKCLPDRLFRFVLRMNMSQK